MQSVAVKSEASTPAAEFTPTENLPVTLPERVMSAELPPRTSHVPVVRSQVRSAALPADNVASELVKSRISTSAEEPAPTSSVEAVPCSVTSAALPASTLQRETYSSQSTSAELDALIDQCKAELDLSKRIELSKQAQAIAQNDAAVYTVAHYGAIFVLDKNLQNFAYSAAVHDFIVPYETNIYAGR